MTEQKDRISLNKGEELELEFRAREGQIYIQKAVVEEQIGSGASCLTYIVRLFTDEYNSSRMIMKEFYPVSDREEFEIKRDGTRLRISEKTADSRIYQNMLDGFRRAFHIQAELSDSRAMEVMVRPYHMAEYGDSVYILSDMHLGTVLSRSLVTSLSDKLWLMYRTAEAVQLLNEQGYLYIDLNPSNILWIPSQKAVKLFDVDSIIPLHDLDKVHKIRVTYPYTPPEVEELIEWFDVNKSVFLKPSWDVYCLGLIFSELLTGEIPTAEDLKTWQENEYKTEQICRQHGCDDPKAAALMKKILTRALSRKFRMRYPSAKEMCQDLNRLKMLLDAQEFIPKKEYAQANYMMESYHILEKWPVYEYTVKEEGKEILDVAVCGDQPMREPFFKAVFSCVHMPGMLLRIKLYSEDARDFMEKMRKENPALEKMVHIYLEDECIWGEEERAAAERPVCDQPAAEIRLYEKSREEMLADDAAMIRSIGSRYLMLLWNDSGEEPLTKELTDEGRAVPPVSSVKKCSYYDEKLFETRIMRWALNLHAFYYRGTYERASKEEIRQSFENDIYNLNSSMRSALSIRYKLGAAGIRTECSDPAREFYRRVLAPECSNRALLDIISDLEHISWCAYMAVNGWDCPSDEELEQYAFTGRNDFKDRERKLHPCLVASRPGNRMKQLEKKDWDKQKLNKKKTEDFDDLELMNLKLHLIAKKKSGTIKPEIESDMLKFERKISRFHNEELNGAFSWLSIVKNRVYTGESNAELVWKYAMDELKVCCKKMCVPDRSIQEYLEKLDREISVIHEYNAYRDYKKSDMDIVRGIPRILSDEAVHTIIKPFVSGRENSWKNILSAVFLDPEEVLLVPMDKSDIDLDFYREFLRLRGCSSRISVCGLGDVAYKDDDAVIDVTGLNAEELGLLQNYHGFNSKRRVMIKNRKLLSLDDPFIEMYVRDIHLTVEETFYLFGAYMDSEKKENAILGLRSRYRGIWSSYCELGAWKWKQLIEQLVSVEGSNLTLLVNTDRKACKAYKTPSVSGRALQLTKMDMVFAKCAEKKLIKSYWLPGEDDELPAEFTCDSENLAKILEKLTLCADREPLKHKYMFLPREKEVSGQQRKQDEYLIRDRTLYVSGYRMKKLLTAPSGESTDLASIMEEGLRTLEKHGLFGSGGRQNLIQDLKINCTDNGISFSFKYASDAVKTCLHREGNILEAMIYFTCLEMGIFDDLNINSEFSWGTKEEAAVDESTVNNEIDIIGNKNLKTYFISAKMTVPEASHLMEIKYFADHFGIDGQAVLVTSNSRTADEYIIRHGSKAERSRMMGVKYINRTVIDEGRLGETIRQIVEEGEDSR